MKHREGTLAEAGDVLSKLQADEAAPDRSTLVRDRTRRNATWTLIRRRFIEDESVSDEELDAHVTEASGTSPGTTPGPIADLYEREVADADALADACFARADAISRREQAEEAIRKEETALAAAREARCDVENRIEAARTEWEALWRSSGFTPQSPNVMKSWLDDFARLRALCDEKAGLSDEAAAVQSRLDAYERELNEALDDTSGSIDTRLDRAESRIRAAREANAQRRTYQERIEQLTEEQSRLEKEAEEAARRREEVEKKAAERRNECALPSSWNLDTISAMLQEIGDLVAEERPAPRRLRTARGQPRNVARLRKTSPRIGGPKSRPTWPRETSCRPWRRSPRGARPRKRPRPAHDKISQTEKAIERRLKDETKKCEEYEAILRELRATAGVESDDEFLEKGRHGPRAR